MYLNPLPSFFSDGISNPIFAFREISYRSGNFSRPNPQIGPRKWGVGVKWLEVRRLGKMAARSDAARKRPPGHPGLQHTSVRPPSDATPPRYCRDITSSMKLSLPAHQCPIIGWI